MKNGKPSLIFDIRYFSGIHYPGQRNRYLDDCSMTAYGRRLAWYLNSENVSLGAYHSLYVNFTSAMPAGEIAIDQHKGGDESWWFRYANVGVCPDFPNIDNANEIAVRGTIAALQTILPNSRTVIEQADVIVRQRAGDLRFLVRERVYSRYILKIAATIGVHPEPSHLYVTVLENGTGARCETAGLPIGFYFNVFDEVRSIGLKDIDIDYSTDGSLRAQWCERIRNGLAASKPGGSNQSESNYSKLVRRQ